MSVPAIVISQNQVTERVDQFTGALTAYLGDLGLPTQNVLVSTSERQRVINNLPSVIDLIDQSKRGEALYLSKFIAACGAGLFDAALNFVWDETVVHLRRKVARFDLEYFYDSVVTDPARRNKLRDESDLTKIEEWELVRGCLLTGILSDIGFRHLDYIRDMRNWASAAHPNQNDLSGLQIIAWLETCIREVIAKEPEAAAIEVKRFLNSVRNSSLTEQDAQHIRSGMELLPTDIVRSLLRTLFGMYTADNATTQLKSNIKLIAGKCWNLAPDDARHECGLRFSTFAANGEVARRTAANEFLTSTSGLGYLPPDTLAVEMAEKVTALHNAHNAFNNFYNEPAHAKSLLAYIPATGRIPEAIRRNYVKTLAMAKIGNGYGVATMAMPHYDAMINLFTEEEFKELVKLLTDREFAARLALRSCAPSYREIISSLVPQTQNQITQTAMNAIIASTDAQLPKLGADSSFLRIINAY